MKYLLIGDPHFSEKNAPVIDKFIEETFKLNLKAYQKIIILGDILDTHEKINLRSLCKAIDFIKKLSKYSKTYVLIGNHDRINNSVYLSEEHPFTGLIGLENIYIINKPFLEENFLYVPYVETGRFYEAISDFDLKKVKTIFAHQEFLGSIFDDKGDKIPDIKTYSGHIHNYRKMANLTYVGTPFQHSYHDNPDKFLLEVDSGKESKIYLDIKKKRIENLKLSQLLDYKVDENYYTKLIICEDKKLLNNKKILKILNSPQISYRLVKNYKAKEKLNSEHKEISFNKLLENRLDMEDINVKNLYQKLVSKITVS